MSLQTYAYAAYLTVAALACSSEPSAPEQPSQLKIAAVEPGPIPAPQAEVQPLGLESRLNTFSLEQKKDRQAAIASLTFTNTGTVPLTEDTGVLSICYAPASNLTDSKYCIAGGDLHVPPIQAGKSTTVNAQVGIYLGKFSCGEGGRVPTVHLSLPGSGYNTGHLINPCPR